MVDEDAARCFPEMRMLALVVDKDVTFLCVVALVDRHHREDMRAGKVLGGLTHLLRCCPLAARQAGQDNRIEMPDRMEQPHRVGHQRERPVKIRMPRDLAPECADAAPLLKGAWRHSQKLRGGPAEIGQYAIAVEIELHR